MQGITGDSELNYAAQFCMLTFGDRSMIEECDRYTEATESLLKSYNRMLQEHAGIILDEEPVDFKDPAVREKAGIVEKVCINRNVDFICRNARGQELLRILVEALCRAMILIRYYLPEGELFYQIIDQTYFTKLSMTDQQICRELHVGRTTYYKKRKKAIRALGYFLFEMVFPEMEGRLFGQSA